MRQVVLLAQQDAEPPPRRIARDPGAVDAAADDEEIVGGHCGRQLRAYFLRLAVFFAAGLDLAAAFFSAVGFDLGP